VFYAYDPAKLAFKLNDHARTELGGDNVRHSNLFMKRRIRNGCKPLSAKVAQRKFLAYQDSDWAYMSNYFSYLTISKKRYPQKYPHSFDLVFSLLIGFQLLPEHT
jgi:hypothetical protein